MKCVCSLKLSRESVTYKLSQTKTQSYEKQFVDFI